MTWGNKNWGRDINRHHGWNVPPAIRDLPLDLKRTGLYPRQKNVIAAAAERYIDDPQEQPIYAPQVLQFAAPNASPSEPVDTYATSSWRAREDGNAAAMRLSEPSITINPIRWAAMKRGAQELPGINSLNDANVGEALQRARPGSLPAGGRSPLGEMIDPRSLVAAAESERLQAANAASRREDARLRAMQTAGQVADSYGRALNGMPKRYR
jgi:hypothetical protein